MTAAHDQDVLPAAPADAAPERIGERFIRAGVLSPGQVEQAVALQARERIRFGEAAVRLGFLTARDVDAVLAEQFNYATALTKNIAIDSHLAIAHAPFSQEAEAIRQIRANLGMRFDHSSKTCIAVTIVSPNENEGKSYIAASLAIAFSQSGKRTLLVNGNLRESGQRGIAGLIRNASSGLSTMLAGRSETSIGDSVEGFPQLHLLGAGPRPPNPLEILSEPALKRLFETLHDRIDIIIVDTPAALASSDAQVIARQTDFCVLVARKDFTPLADLDRTQALLGRAGVTILGTVYNAFQTPSAKGLRLNQDKTLQG